MVNLPATLSAAGDARHDAPSGGGEPDLRAIADALPSMIGYWDRNLINRFANRAYENWFGAAPRSLCGTHMSDLLGRELYELNRPYAELVLRGAPVNFERRVPGPGGVAAHVMVHYTPDCKGEEVLGFYVMAHDITLFKEAQQGLADSETFLEQAGAVSGVGGFRIDLLSGRQTWTRQTFRIYEMDTDVAPSAEELDKLMAPEVGARLWNAIRIAAESGVGYDIELPVATTRGRPIWIRTIGVVEFDNGKPARVVGAVQDITDRKVAAEALRAAGERLELATDAAGIGVWEWDIARDVLRWDEQMHELYGRPQSGELSYGAWTQIVHPDDRQRVLEESAAALHAGQKFDTEFRVVLPTGEIRHLKEAAQVQRDPGGAPQRMVGVCFDITKRKVIEQALVESEVKFRSLFELSPVGIALNDLRSGRFLNLNDSLAEPTGYTREELLGMSYQDITPPNGHFADDAYLSTLEVAGRYGPHEKELLRKDGSTYPVLVSGLRMADASGRPLIWSIVQDISIRKAMESQLADAARRDKLTGLANRSLFIDRLERAVARVKAGSQAYFAVLFLDFDRFKLINDTLGHEAGDELLRQIAKRLRRELRASDTVSADETGNVVSRFGGDEFLLLINDLQAPQDASRIAERLLNSLAPAYDLQGSEVHSSASIGIITSDQCHSSADDVVRNADVAMYEAKRAGRACSVVFNEAMQTRLTRHVTIENCLRRALGTAELYLMYQPIVELATGRLVSAEALVRWRHPSLGMIPPSEFIPIAEESGLIVALGQWVQQEACQTLAAWRRQDPARAPYTVSVNVSRAELGLGRQLLEQVQATLARTGLPARCLQLEVTEREVMSRPEEARNLLLELQGLGVQLAMDDFGTGTSSLGCLHSYPFNTIKIDRYFVQDLTGNQDVLAVIHATINLVENLGKISLAEGVEEAAQVAVLLSLGCRYAQGYFFSAPVLPEFLLSALDAREAASSPTPGT